MSLVCRKSSTGQYWLVFDGTTRVGTLQPFSVVTTWEEEFALYTDQDLEEEYEDGYQAAKRAKVP